MLTGCRGVSRRPERERFGKLRRCAGRQQGFDFGPKINPAGVVAKLTNAGRYAASKASSDHLVRSYRETLGLNTLVTNCSNNYGLHQSPEELIPLV